MIVRFWQHLIRHNTVTIPASIGAFFLSRAASGSSSMCPELVTARVTPANRFFMAKPESISARHVVFTEQASTPPSSSNTWTPEKKEFWTNVSFTLKAMTTWKIKLSSQSHSVNFRPMCSPVLGWRDDMTESATIPRIKTSRLLSSTPDWPDFG